MWHDDILGTIGNTPLVRLNKLTKGIRATVLVKNEAQNPGGSVKDRIGIAMIEDAEARGLLKPGGTIIEGTSGNTGMGLALAAAVKGYRCIFTMPDKMSQEKIDALRALGAEVIVTPTAVAHEDPRSYHAVALRLSREIPGAYFPNQYDNPSNPLAHYRTTGPEIWRDTDGKITHFVAGIGTGGTITGTARYLKEQNPDVQIVGVDPEGSIFAGLYRTGELPQTYPYKVEGIGQDEKPDNVDFSVIDSVMTVGDRDSFLTARDLARTEGIFSGGSTGSIVFAAVELARTLPADALVVAIVCDQGGRYLSKVYNDNWMREHQFLASTRVTITAHDILSEKNAAKLGTNGHGLVAIVPQTPLLEAISLMQAHQISQVPILSDGEVIGSLNENQILKLLMTQPERRDAVASEVMDKPLPVVTEQTLAEHIVKHLDRETPAVLVRRMDGSFGIITKSDLIATITSN